MTNPPPSGPHSDIGGVNRDARVGSTSKAGDPEPGSAVKGAKDQSTARPDETAPPE